jgi:hypothetical protein
MTSPKETAKIPDGLRSWSEIVEEEMESTPSDLLSELEGR